MGTVEKIATGLVLVALATTLVLPDRQTAQVVQAGGGVFNQALKTAEGR
jgi:hypothetical protein